VSDVLLFRESLSVHLRKDGRLEFVGAGLPTEDTLVALEKLAPDAVILDLAMRDSIEFAQQIRDRARHARTVAFAASDIGQRVVACARAGICGYIPKDGTANDIVMTVLHAVRGELLCSPKFAAMLLAQLAAVAPQTVSGRQISGLAAKLTPREREVLDRIGQGLTNKQIARDLGISCATVKNHVHHLLEKLAVQRRSQALAHTHGSAVAPAEVHG
jgi:two-component system nitrate/nitrite response regulator NarL